MGVVVQTVLEISDGRRDSRVYVEKNTSATWDVRFKK